MLSANRVLESSVTDNLKNGMDNYLESTYNQIGYVNNLMDLVVKYRNIALDMFCEKMILDNCCDGTCENHSNDRYCKVVIDNVDNDR